MRFRAPANVVLRRAQLTLILAAMLPTILATPVGISLLVLHNSAAVTIVGGVLVVAFCTSALTGYILASIFITRGASLAKVQQDFLSSVSHELTTPITSVRLFIDTLKSGRVTDEAERAKCLDIIDREMGRLDGLVGKLIALSKLESGRQPFEHKPVRVADIIDEALASFEVVRVGAAVDMTVEVEPDLEVTGDHATLVTVISNLLGNAWKYTAAGERKIGVSARGDRRQVVIDVSDNGPGVPEEERRRIFEEFARGRAASQSRAAGFGLGLAIVRAIVRAHSGRVELEDNPGGGSIFRVALPRRMAGPLAAVTARAAT